MSRVMEDPFLVFDVGGSHVSAAACWGHDFRLGHVAVAPNPKVQTSVAFTDFLHELGSEAEAGCGSAVGAMLAVPGPFDLEAGISLMRHKLSFLYGVSLRDAMAGSFGWQPGQVHFLNDAAAFLLGEVGAGAARGFDRAVGITLGTGVGSAFVVNGRLIAQGSGIPPSGEIWNLPYEGGIVEDYVSSRAIGRRYEELTGCTRDVAGLAAAAQHDAVAEQVFVEFGAHLGRVLDTRLAGFSSEVIVVGGGISKSAHLFLSAARSQMRKPARELRVSELLDRAPLVGCGVAWLAGDDSSDISANTASAHPDAT